MDVLHIQVFGSFVMRYGGQPLPAMTNDKARALLTYLALEGSQPRTSLAALLWPYLPAAAAFDNLRKTLYRLRQKLDEVAPGVGDLLITDRQTVQLDSQRVKADAVHFRNLLAECELHGHGDIHTCAACLTRLAEAVESYHGELLTGFGLGDAPIFEEWLLLRRETLHQGMLLALTTLTMAWEQQGDLARAHSYASRSLALDPYREETHRQQMRLLARLGLPNQAMQQYERCRQLLREELGVPPDATTVALYEQIRNGKLDKAPPVPSLLSTPSPPPLSPSPFVNESSNYDWGETPETGRVYGRQPELAQLKAWLVTEHCQVVTLLGMGGLGKTTLAATSVRAVAPQFDTVIWRSLLNAPPLDELLAALLQRLSNHTIADLPSRLDEQLALLLTHLRQQRCLLVLDNLESVLQAEAGGGIRRGYEAYVQLMRQVTENRHNSCLLVTSREQPQALARWEAEFPWVRSLRLQGLDMTAGGTLLTERGVMGEAAEVERLVQRYAGHPLALKLVAETVQDLFDGAIGDFLQEPTSIFGDLCHMLDKQWLRLAPLEQKLLFWLAIDRQPISTSTLRQNLVQPVTASLLLEALRSLQRRSLLERVDNHFVLQNVVMEYVTARLIEGVYTELVTDWTHDAIEDAAGQAHHPITASLLNNYALSKATAKEYVRQSQERLLLRPVADRLTAQWTKGQLQARFRALLAVLRTAPQKEGYAAGNLLNLLLCLGYDVSQYDFSHLAVRQAYLRGQPLAGINFTGSDLTHSVFTDAFHNAHAIAFSPDSERLLVGMGDGTIRIWSSTGEPLDVWTGNGKAVWLLAFRPASAAAPPLLATDGAHWSINLWDIESKRVVQRLTGHTTVVHDLTFSADGHQLAACGEDGTVHVWEVATGHKRHVLAGHSIDVECVAFSPDGRWLASGSQDSTVCLWDLQTGTVAHTLHGHTNTVSKVAFCPMGEATGRRLVTASWDHTLRVWDGETGETLHILRGHSGEISALALSKDGSFAISAGHEPTVWVWDLHSGRVRQTLHDHVGWVASATLAPNDRQVATIGFDQTIRLWDLPAVGPEWADGHASLRLQGHHRPAGVLRFDAAPDGVPSLTLVNYDLAVYTWNVETQQLTHTQSGPPTKHDDFAPLALAPNAQGVASRDAAYGIQLWSPITGQVASILSGHTDRVTALQFSPDGWLLASGSGDTTVRLWALNPEQERGQSFATLSAHTTKVTAVAFSPDGHLLASAGRDQLLQLWDVVSGARLATLVGHTKAVLCLAFGAAPPTSGAESTPYTVLVSGGIDRTVRIWHLYQEASGITYTAPVICTRPDQTDSIAWVAISPDGRWVASASWDCTVTIWDAADGHLVHDLRGHGESVKFLAFAADSQWLASSSHDETVRLWDMQTGACQAILSPPGPYAGMNITDATGINDTQKAALKRLGAVEEADEPESGPVVSPLPPITPALSNLPEATTLFVGRVRALQEISERLHQPGVRLLTLVGPGGIGKTRLALEAVRRIAESSRKGESTLGVTAGQPRFADGIFFVALAALTTSSALAPTIAATLALPLTGTDPEQSLLTFLRARQLLLILDNFEHLLDGVDLVVKILQSAPGIQLIITTREQLNVQGEQCYVVREMDYTLGATWQEASQASAVQLFVQQAQRVQADFQLHEGNSAAVLRICQLVQGLPLGLELAAAWVEVLSLPEIAAEIEKSVDFLTVDWHNVPERQRSMRAVFVWSWQLLTPTEQQVFGKLALFRGGFTRDAAEKVAGASLRILAALMRKSLIQRVESGATPDARYAIHELLRQFAAEELGARAEEQGVTQQQYSNYFLTFVAARTNRLQRSEPRQAAHEIHRELDNIRQAWRFAVQQQLLPVLERSMTGLREFYVFVGLTNEGAEIFEMAITALRHSLTAELAGADQAHQRYRQRLLSQLLGFAGSFCIGMGQHTTAQGYAEEALRLGQAAEGIEGEALGSLLLGQALRRLGQSKEAQIWLERAIEIAQRKYGTARYGEVLADVERRAYGWLCSIALTNDDYRAAQRYAELGLQVCHDIGRVTGEIVCLTDVINIAQTLGNYTAAQAACEQALRLAHKIEFRWGEATVLWNMGEVLRLRGEYTRAAALLKQAITLFRATDQSLNEILVVQNLGRLYSLMGSYAQAQSWFDHAAQMLQGLHFPARETYLGLLPHAMLAHFTGNQPQALHYAERAWQMAQGLYGQADQADALIILGLVREQAPDLGAAAQAYQQALDRYDRLELHHKAAEALAGLARVALQQGNGPVAQGYVDRILPMIKAQASLGLDEPFLIYLTCYQVLTATHDPQAPSLLQRGYDLLQRYISAIEDPILQQSFLQQVPVHRQLMAAYQLTAVVTPTIGVRSVP